MRREVFEEYSRVAGLARWAAAAAALLALALAAPAAAASPRIGIAPVKGAGRGAGAQLKEALCATHRCVAATGGSAKASLARAKKRGAKAVVFASVKRGNRELVVALVSPNSRKMGSWALPLGRDRLVPADRLDALAEEIDAALGYTPVAAAARSRSPRGGYAAKNAYPAPAPAPRDGAGARNAYGAPAGDEPDDTVAAADGVGGADGAGGGFDAPEPRRANLQARAAPVQVAAAPANMDVVTVPVMDDPDGPSPRRRSADMPRYGESSALPPPFAAEGGVEGARHALKFPSNGTAPVGYVVNLNAVPRVRLELNPFREEGEALSTLGFFAEGGYLPGIPLAGDARNFRMTYLRFRGGALARFDWDWIVVRPTLAYEVERVSVRAGGNRRYPGLPDTALSGPSAGLDLSVPVGKRLALLGSGRGIWWMQAGELAGGKQYFPSGRAIGFELEAGASFRIVGAFSCRILGAYSATRWWLGADPSRTYTVTAALSDSWGARGMLRLDL